ncbi:MAG: hypothetical protein HY930_03030 [Euryarchaeota archaeon]|nr:hypothetical protein [Euryarchaeota archaeon]
MTSCAIAIVTERPRFYYEAVGELKNRSMPFLSLKLGQEIPSRVSVVLTTTQERKKINFPNVVANEDAQAAVNEALRILKGFGTRHKKLIIGIDPGRKPGVAVVGDGKIIETQNLNSPEDVLKCIKDFLAVHSANEFIVRVGGGGGIYKLQILKLLQENLRLRTEIVDETSTTPAGKSNTTAAINIALKEGRPLSEKIKLSPKPGEIKNLQKESRLLSGNITISRKLAEEVAKGKLSLEEAIEIQKKI